MSGTSGMGFQPTDSQSLNQAAAHDTSLYDPNIHDNQIVAMYDTDADARAARDVLMRSNIPDSAIRVVSKGAETGTLGGVNAEDQGGVWGAIRSMFVPDEDRTAYTHAVGRGHAMLVVTPTGNVDRQNLVRILEGTNPVDFDARLEEWRQAGYDTTTAHADYAGSSVGMAAPAATAATATAMPAATSTAMPAAAATAVAGAAHDTLKVMEERLRVGKREVSGGMTRIRSYVVERPVEEQVRLREEHVSVERHAVDRPATDADFAAFQERTIEARATSEEAVVSKEARVVEEIGLRKEASERTETVRDTVRKTEVEVEDGGHTKAGGTTMPQPNTGASTSGATTSGANKPR